MLRSAQRLTGMFLIALALVAAQSAHARSVAPQVEGEYDATIVADGETRFDFILVVTRGDDGALRTEVRNGGDINITAIAVEGEKVTLTATYQVPENVFQLPGTLNETGMGGKWQAGEYSGSWSAKRRAP